MNKEVEYPYQNLSLENMEGEIWKDISGHEGAYKVSNLGRVKSLAREIFHSRGVYVVKEDKILKQYITKARKTKFRKVVTQQLCYSVKSYGMHYRGTIARLVYGTFVTSLDTFREKMVVSHYDDDPFNNRVDNLYAQTHSELGKQKIETGKSPKPIPINLLPLKKKNAIIKKKSIPVTQYTLEGEYVATYPSISEAARQLGVLRGNISSVIIGKCSHCKGFIWRKGQVYKKIDTLSIQAKLDKSVNQYDLEGNYIATYPNMSIAAKKMGVWVGNISTCVIKKRGTCGGYIWRKEKKKKISVPSSQNKKKVSQYDLQGNYIATYSSIREASLATNAGETVICTVVKNNKGTAGGFIWKEAKYPR